MPDNVINGTADNDSLTGTLGDDTINGGAGQDFIQGEDGSDTLNGGTDNDYIQGGLGNDTLNGGDGNDTLQGQAGNDVLNGEAGDDYLYDYQGLNTLNGGAGNDTISVGGDSAIVDAGADNDLIEFWGNGLTLTTGTGSDTLRSNSYGYTATVTDFTVGNGGDVFDLSQILNNFPSYPGGNPFATGHVRAFQSGANTLIQFDYDGGGNSWNTAITLQNVIAANLTAYNFGGYGPDGSAVDGQTIDGTANGDSLIGTLGNDTINGLAGSDSIVGGDGSDTLNGGTDNDYIQGGLGNDTLNGGDGNDTLQGQAGNDVLNGEAGDDYLYDYQGLNTLNGGAGNDTISVGGDSAIVDAGADNDLIEFWGNGLTLTTGTGSDTLRSNSYGYTATVTDFTVGNGGDVFDLSQILNNFPSYPGGNPFATGHVRAFQSGANTLIQFDYDGGGNSWNTAITLQNVIAANLTAYNFGGYGPDGSAVDGQTIDGTANGDSLIGTLGNDTINGLAGSDSIVGGDGSDTLNGGTDNDYIQGGLGNDTLNGGDGNDTLQGQAGNDVLNGEAGDDYLYDYQGLNTLNGGAGSDTLYVYNTGSIYDGGADNDAFYIYGDTNSLTAGAGSDKIFLNYLYSPSTISDFTAGVGGDIFEIKQLLAQFGNYSGGNPFATGHLRVDQSGVNALLQYDYDGATNGASFSTLLTLDGVTAANLVAFNFGGYALDGTIQTTPVGVPSSASGNEDTVITGQVSAVDPDTTTLTYTRVGNVSHGTLSFSSNGSWSYTPAANYHGTDSFTFTATDGVETSTPVTVSLTINSVNDVPVVDLNGASAGTGFSTSFTEGGSAVAFVGSGMTATDQDANDPPAVTVTLVDAKPGDTFVLSTMNAGVLHMGTGMVDGNLVATFITSDPFFYGPNGFARLADALKTTVKYANPSDDPTVGGTATIRTIEIAFSDGTTTTAATSTITIVGVNDLPVITSNGGGPAGTASVLENTTAVTTVQATDPDGTPTYSIAGGDDAALFQINAATGALSFIAAPNWDAPADAEHDNVYNVTVRASDGVANDTQALAVTVTNLIDKEELTGPGYPAPGGNSFTGSGSSRFDGGATGVYAGFNTAAADNIYWGLQNVQAAMDGTNANRFDAPGETLTFVGISNNGLTATWIGTTNVPVGTGYSGIVYTKLVVTIGSAQTSGDAHWVTAGSLGYSTGPAALIDVDESKGQFTINTQWLASTSLDGTYDSIGDWYNINSTAGGTLQLNSSGVFYARLLNSVPTIDSNGGGTSAAISLAENGTEVTTVHATDPDISNTVAYSIVGGADAALFSIDGTTGVLTFNAAPNFESPNDAGGDHVYNLTVRASDGTASDDQSLTVTVSNANDLPTGGVTISGDAEQYATLTASNTIADEDGIFGTIQYAWFRDDLHVGTGSTYALTQADVGGVFHAVASYTDGLGNLTVLVSADTPLIVNINDAPTITSAAAEHVGSVDEKAEPGEGGTLSDTGTIAFADVDLSDDPNASVTSRAVTSSTLANSYALTVAQETALKNAFSIDTAAPFSSATGTGTVDWSYSIADGALDFLGDDDSVTLTFAVEVADGQGGTASQNVVITVSGTNDAPTITSAAAEHVGSVDEKAEPGEGGTLSDTGTIAFADVDLSDDPSASVTSRAVTSSTLANSYALTVAQETALKNAFSIDTAAPFSSATGTGTVDWSYSIADGALDFLGDDDSVTLTFAVEVADGQGGTASQNVVITVSGTNDAPVAVADTNAVNEDATATGQVIRGTSTGVGRDSDTDLADVLNLATVSGVSGAINVAPTGFTTVVGAYGTLTVGANGAYSYVADGDEADVLATNQVVHDIFTYVISDGQGGTATTTLDLSIKGINDSAPAINGTNKSETLNGDVSNIGADDTISGGQGSDRIDGKAGSDHLYGGVGEDVIFGGDGIDWLYGESGSDELWGGKGRDYLIGDVGDDKLFGEAGNDILVGGQGNDRMDGGAGIDTFVFLAGKSKVVEQDRIVGFDFNADIINLDGVSITGTSQVAGSTVLVLSSGAYLTLEGIGLDDWNAHLADASWTGAHISYGHIVI